LDSTGSFNTGVGVGALALNNGNSNTAVGAAALLLNSSGNENTVVGTNALVFNDSGDFNSAVGAGALHSNIDGDYNSAFGTAALYALLPCELKRKKPERQKEQDFHHNVYVVLLKDAVTKHPSILRLNPKRDPLKPCVYVGMTGIPVDHRFENHKNGYKSAWVVRKYGMRLMPELYEHLNPMPFEAAVQMESELAEDLRAAGYTVTGGH
jgi:hypothetical protein